MNYYLRQIMLWGEERQESLKDKRLLIVGSGGLGCSIALALSGTGVGEIDILDFDRVEEHNIHRQLLFRVDDIGEYKAKVASNRIKERNPNLKSQYFISSFEEFNSFDSKSYDLILDATDNLAVRERIDAVAKRANIAWVYGSVEEFNGRVSLFKDAKFSLFASKDIETKGISAPMVMQVASLQADLALRYLLGLKVATDILYYLYYSSDGEFEIKKFKLPKERM